MNLIFILNLESHHQILANENLFHHHSNHFYISPNQVYKILLAEIKEKI